jgi:hypothetical protein
LGTADGRCAAWPNPQEGRLGLAIRLHHPFERFGQEAGLFVGEVSAEVLLDAVQHERSRAALRLVSKKVTIEIEAQLVPAS